MNNLVYRILKTRYGFGNPAIYVLPSTFILLFLLITLVTSFLNAYGYDDDIQGKWWKNKKIVTQLELSNDQVNRIEGIFSSNKARIKELDSDLRKKERELNDTIRNPNSGREEVLKLSNGVEEIRGIMRRIKLDMLLQIRDVLTPEQRSKLQGIWSKCRKPFH